MHLNYREIFINYFLPVTYTTVFFNTIYNIYKIINKSEEYKIITSFSGGEYSIIHIFMVVTTILFGLFFIRGKLLKTSIFFLFGGLVSNLKNIIYTNEEYIKIGSYLKVKTIRTTNERVEKLKELSEQYDIQLTEEQIALLLKKSENYTELGNNIIQYIPHNAIATVTNSQNTDLLTWLAIGFVACVASLGLYYACTTYSMTKLLANKTEEVIVSHGNTINVLNDRTNISAHSIEQLNSATTALNSEVQQMSLNIETQREQVEKSIITVNEHIEKVTKDYANFQQIVCEILLNPSIKYIIENIDPTTLYLLENVARDYTKSLRPNDSRCVKILEDVEKIKNKYQQVKQVGGTYINPQELKDYYARHYTNK